jgi:predicted dithiol-disulfide oxidoreductase (DUF899 family)
MTAYKGEELFYSFMFIPGDAGLPLEQGCPSSIIDAIDGEVPHLTQRINFAVVTKPPIDRFRAHAQKLGWRHARLLSSANTTYNRDYQAETPDGDQLPIATVFARHEFDSFSYLVAGPPAMVEAMVAMLQTEGITQEADQSRPVQRLLRHAIPNVGMPDRDPAAIVDIWPCG